MGTTALDEAVERSAAPAAVAVALERLTEAHPGLDGRLAEDERLRRALVAVLAASRSLTDLCVTEPAAFDVLSDLDQRRELGTPESTDDLRRWKRLEFLRIAARDLTGVDDFPEVGRALSELAADVLEGACTLSEAEGLAVIGMGKLGGRELNYASDIDVLFVSRNGAAQGDERTARAVLAAARTCFRLDANLRPEGRDGPLTRSLDSYQAYWERWAETWEFQALIKARPVAGDAELGSTFHAQAQERLWDRPFTADDLRAVRMMKARAEAELARRGLTDREVKRGRGGIRDIEFAIQLLQLVHGRHDADLRSPNTLDALAELVAAGYVDAEDGAALDHAYRLLRTVEHRLQLEREQQVHAIPTDPKAQDRLARVMGYRDGQDATAREQLIRELRRVQAGVRSIHEHLFFRPLLDALAAQPAGPQLPARLARPAALMSDEAVVERLSAFGFTDAKRTRVALGELTRGLTRSSRLMQQMLPLLLGWLSEAPDPDLGLLGLRKLASGARQAAELATAFRDSPESARRLCILLGTSRRLAETLERNPDMIPSLGTPAGLAPRTREATIEAVTTTVSWRQAPEDRQRALRRFRRREELRIAAADVLGLVDGHPTDGSRDGRTEDIVVATARQLTSLAEASLEAALAVVAPPLPLAVIAMGRFGGAELSYASDLDVLLVYDGNTPEDFAKAEKAGEALLRFVGGSTPANQVYPIDLDLRPEGKDGPLVRSLDGYRTYYERWVAVWELQALVRARFVAGDADLGRRFLALVDPFVWRTPFPEADVREIRRMKARVERERIPPGEDPQFHLKLGRGSLSDIEWTAQLLQLQHGIRATGTMAALDALKEASILEPSDHSVLADAYRFCERARNRWFLIKGSPDDSLPVRAEPLGHLASSLDTTPSELREAYRRVTRRARRVVERLFYGKED
ncbi:MAG: bifunctional [glutamine synthetase] adenylyltransferase/[glutamine synthetase]-adenylyl-L-tyrosine phosphorylase [Actinomycetota bacterium]|nr:bifunctional [glutamine synthetase] adenylyltransferase/[glutamine synthetase]-adenylyl-L-tyrosine phosphorylase [Actinomycetota bacterium]